MLVFGNILGFSDCCALVLWPYGRARTMLILFRIGDRSPMGSGSGACSVAFELLDGVSLGLRFENSRDAKSRVRSPNSFILPCFSSSR